MYLQDIGCVFLQDDFKIGADSVMIEDRKWNVGNKDGEYFICECLSKS